MKDSPAKPQLPRMIAAWPLFASRFAVVIGTTVIAGWAFDLERLKRIVPGFVAMNPATAVFFVLCGAALELIVRYRTNRAARIIAKLLASAVVAGTACEVLELAGVWHSVVDELLFSSKLARLQEAIPNRMAPNTACNFFVLGLSLLMIDQPRRHAFAQGLAVIAAFGAILPITGYAYGVRSFRGVASFIPMALHTAATFLVLSGGLFFAIPDGELTEVFAARDARGVLARSLFPLAVFVTLFLGWLRISAERNGWFEAAFGTALYATILSVLLAILVRWTVSAVGKVEAERAAAHARLQALNRRKDEMIAVVSHDLCSPLTGFRMVIDLLRERNEPSEHLLNLMDQSARRMVAMVRGLLDVSKLQSDKMTLQRKHVLVSELIRQSIEPLTINANAKQIALHLDVAPSEPTIYADPLRLTQIFNNLLSNAVKFTSPGGSVLVTVNGEAQGVTIIVEDTGLGIPEQELPHIFEKFHQTTTKPTGDEVGAGLGLAIVRELVLLHDGKISVASKVGEGTTFTVFIPQAAVPSLAVVPEQRAA